MRFLDAFNTINNLSNPQFQYENPSSNDETEQHIQDHNIGTDSKEDEDENFEDESSELKEKVRYLQIAFNDDSSSVSSILPYIPKNSRILIEAGTPFIKKEGMYGIRRISQLWGGYIIADMKIADGAMAEVDMAANAGASAVTALGNAPIETLNIFVSRCKERGIDSMLDMLNVEDPLKVLLHLKFPPDVVIIHKGRDEENTRGKVIPYKQINKIKSKYSTLISAAGGVDLREARSAIFNGANIVVVNIVNSDDLWKGINSDENIEQIAQEFLDTIE
jgi:bifunctional enzyme Fae/Hps